MKTSELYFKNHIDNKVILVDFDNTICIDEWPNIGELIPGALDVLKKLQESGHTLILYTQRSTEFPVCNPKLVEYMSKYPRLVSKTDSTYDFHSTNNVKKIEIKRYPYDKNTHEVSVKFEGKTWEDAIMGACDIIAEIISDNAERRKFIGNYNW